MLMWWGWSEMELGGSGGSRACPPGVHIAEV